VPIYRAHRRFIGLCRLFRSPDEFIKTHYRRCARNEEVFRQDLYQLFSDKRFVRSADSVELRGVQGDLTTDVDALIFEGKTGVLALFELKSQDLFASSPQERRR
jgi:hypothetical protein